MAGATTGDGLCPAYCPVGSKSDATLRQFACIVVCGPVVFVFSIAVAKTDDRRARFSRDLALFLRVRVLVEPSLCRSRADPALDRLRVFPCNPRHGQRSATGGIFCPRRAGLPDHRTKMAGPAGLAFIRNAAHCGHRRWDAAIYQPGDQTAWLAYARLYHVPPSFYGYIATNSHSIVSLIVELLPATLVLPFVPWPWRRVGPRLLPLQLLRLYCSIRAYALRCSSYGRASTAATQCRLRQGLRCSLE